MAWLSAAGLDRQGRSENAGIGLTAPTEASNA